MNHIIKLYFCLIINLIFYTTPTIRPNWLFLIVLFLLFFCFCFVFCSFTHITRFWYYTSQPNNSVREYFGEHVAMYFAFLAHYTTALAILAVVRKTIILLCFCLINILRFIFCNIGRVYNFHHFFAKNMTNDFFGMRKSHHLYTICRPQHLILLYLLSPPLLSSHPHSLHLT